MRPENIYCWISYVYVLKKTLYIFVLQEIIQNAEDAEASQMKILYDERCVNQSDGSKGKSFQKYFKVYIDCHFRPYVV